VPRAPLGIKGQRFGRLTAVDRVANSPRGASQWRCVCTCGRETVAVGSDLARGRWSSCGCASQGARVDNPTTHGKSYTPEYKALRSARLRCRNADSKSYPGYGGRGIEYRMPEDMGEAVRVLVECIGLRPSDAHSLDRVDNDGHYEPTNLRWATRSQQQRNKRRKAAHAH